MTDVKEHFGKSRKVALYMYMGGALQGYVTVREVRYVNHDERYKPLPEGQLREELDGDNARISEPIEVTFVACNNDEMVANAVAALDEEERRLLMELNRKIAEVRGRKAQFLALSHNPDVGETS